jgi:hypothetical protein
MALAKAAKHVNQVHDVHLFGNRLILFIRNSTMSLTTFTLVLC